MRGNVREQRAGIDVDGVPAGWLDHGVPDGRQPLRQILHGANTVAQIVFVQDLPQSLGDRFEVPPRKASISREAFGEDQKIARFLGPARIIHGQKPADVHQAVLLGAHCAAVGEAKHLLRDVDRPFLPIAGLAKFDEICVFGEPAGVQKQRDAVAVAQGAGRFQILHRDRLSPAGVVGHRQHA